ncbi:DUF4436 domain-containing protein [Candidatus Mycobacterium wuenschmannii]|uniref:DUF4436 domain-containing protein n=1 Tax=Candidatus Mycobacterium wuenschmannii TaxID=3027808 RepID=A0ABY8W735_9MYCO|nr:DUF4436 domain-containing protein [Candidatus Mycobacterium wuenschmannii]WIM90262.1 DUF4436 domain-containing protein [Candidatus Mycobacterium wuenschmannii]
MAAVAVFVAAYIATIVLYSHTGMGRPHEISHGQPTSNGTTVICDVEEVASVKGVLTVNLTVVPGPDLLDPVTHGLKDDLSVAVTSAVTPTKRSWLKGVVPGVFPVPLIVSGDPSSWPFDRYETGPVTVELFPGGQPPQRASVTVFDRIPGWKVTVPDAGGGATPSPYHVILHRSPSTAAFAAVILAVLIALAGLALFVAVQTLAYKREFFPPMTTWYAALLFSVVPLRTALPDAPPIGFWVDVTVVLWVIVVLVISMGLYVYCWWRHVSRKT